LAKSKVPQADTVSMEEELTEEDIFRPDMDWYIIHTYSGLERSVRDSVQQRVKVRGLSEKVGNVVIPTRGVVELKDGKRVTVDKKMFPGYLLVQMKLDDDTWYLIKNTPKVSGFLGAGGKPIPLPRHEVDTIFERIGAAEAKAEKEFFKGDYVKVIDGPFENFSGVIEEVIKEKQRVRVPVSIFGRSTPVELDFLQVEKL